ncbi:MAG: hypothetical protein M1816_000663 [Peltula sp. TS41687]|nr:MAG: hypothetical protein M1816_000663 [Peltula sp. TS41687]
MVQWKRIFSLEPDRDRHRHETDHLLPIHHDDDLVSAAPPLEVTKVALRLKYLIEQVIPCEIEVDRVTKPNSPIITPRVEKAAKEAGGEEYRGCVVFCLLSYITPESLPAKFSQNDCEFIGAEVKTCRAKESYRIESEEDQSYLQEEILLRRYSTLRDGQETVPTNVVERASDLHALRVIASSGYQRCISYLWRGWLVQDENDPSKFVPYKKRASTNYWDHFNPERMRAPVYQNAVQIFFSILYLVLYSQVINSINYTGDIDVGEWILYVFTAGFIFDELNKIRKVGRYYIGFWNVFNSTLYALLTASFIFRLMALAHSPDNNLARRHHYNQLSYNFLAFSAPFFWIRLLFYLDTFRFFGAMLVVLKVMMKESLIFFALLLFVLVGFLQAFVGMDYIDTDKDSTKFIVQGMVNTIMASPDFSGFETFAPPFGIILYYIFTFVVTVVLLNILIALYNTAYSNITENAADEYMALFSQRTIQYARAPDENVFIAPFNLIEIFLLVLPFEWWLARPRYEKLNDIVMLVIYSPLLLITAWNETRQASSIKFNRQRGETDEDTTEEWEQFDRRDIETHEWKERCADVKPNLQVDAATTEVRALRDEIRLMKKELKDLFQAEAKKIAD